MNGTSSPSRGSPWVLPALAGILGLAAALRVREMLATPLWADEAYVVLWPWPDSVDS